MWEKGRVKGAKEGMLREEVKGWEKGKWGRVKGGGTSRKKGRRKGLRV